MPLAVQETALEEDATQPKALGGEKEAAGGPGGGGGTRRRPADDVLSTRVPPGELIQCRDDGDWSFNDRGALQREECPNRLISP
jgi:hypothetical protein